MSRNWTIEEQRARTAELYGATEADEDPYLRVHHDGSIYVDGTLSLESLVKMAEIAKAWPIE